MTRTGLVTSLVLGMATLTSVASAQDPRDRWRDDRYRDDRYSEEGQRWRDDRYPRYDDDQQGWTPLATMSVGPRQTAFVGRRSGWFSRLRLQAVRGSPYIDYIYVRYGNGEPQRIAIGRELFAGESIDVDLLGNQRRISTITVAGPRDRYSRVTIVGLR
jgi:hypothetical protein